MRVSRQKKQQVRWSAPGAYMVCFRNSKEANPVERSEHGPESGMGSERQRGDRKSSGRLIGHYRVSHLERQTDTGVTDPAHV